MRKPRKLAAVTGVSLRERAVGLVRPGVEAVLLAAVAFGCAQAGWSLIAPNSAGASATGDEPERVRVAGAAVRSPFAPEAVAADAASHAAQTLLASVQLAGVRMANDPAQSGAVFTLDGETQRAFTVGQEISAGVRLTEVGADYVLLSYAGGQQQISMPAAPTYSFARALMGEAQRSAPLSVSYSAAAPSVGAAPSAQDAQWLRQTLTRLETNEEGARGWRVSGALPAALSDAGLQDGDLILTINGVGPENPVGAVSAASSGSATLSILRGAQRLSITITRS